MARKKAKKVHGYILTSYATEVIEGHYTYKNFFRSKDLKHVFACCLRDNGYAYVGDTKLAVLKDTNIVDVWYAGCDCEQSASVVKKGA